MGIFSTMISYASCGLLFYMGYQGYKVYKDVKEEKNNKK